MRVRRFVATVAVLGSIAGGCSSGPDDGELDLDAGEATAAPTETDPDPAVTETEPPSSAEEDERLYPPLPPLEPDPDSEVSIEDQEFFLDLHARVYEITQDALTQPEATSTSLETVLADPLLADVISTVERFVADGLASRAPDTEIAWVRVVEVSGGPATVQECRRYGPLTGLYDVATADLVQGEPVRDFVIETRYDVVRTGAGASGTFAVEARGFEPEAGCDG